MAGKTYLLLTTSRATIINAPVTAPRPMPIDAANTKSVNNSCTSNHDVRVICCLSQVFPTFLKYLLLVLIATLIDFFCLVDCLCDNGTGPITLISLFFVSHLFYLFFIPRGRLSWLPVSFLLHVKYTLSYDRNVWYYY